MTEINQTKLPWAQIVQDLQQSGCSVYRAAKILGKPVSTVQHWASGGEPNYSNGATLLMLHATVCGEELTNVRCREGSVYVPLPRAVGSA